MLLLAPVHRCRPQDLTRGLPGEKRAVHFDIDLAVSDAAYATRRHERGLEPAAGARTRGLFGDLLSGAVRVVVMKFAAPWLVGHAVGFLERHVQPGIVHIADPDPATWTTVDRLNLIGLPNGRPCGSCCSSMAPSPRR